MTINTLIDTLTQVARLENRRFGLAAAVAVAEADMAKAPAGYKTTIARCKVREATNALEELDQQMKTLHAQTAGCEDATIYFAKSYANYTLKCEKLDAAAVAMDAQLTAALEEAKKGAWKWQGRKDVGEPAAVINVRKEIADVTADREALEKSYAFTKAIIEGYRVEELKDIEFKAWLAGGSKPEFVRLRQEAERMEFLKGCIVLKMSPPETILEEEEVEEEEVEAEDPAWWSMSMEEYIGKHVLKKLEPVEEKKVMKEKPVNYKAPSTSWIASFAKRNATESGKQNAT